jgi:hypothetical protein
MRVVSPAFNAGDGQAVGTFEVGTGPLSAPVALEPAIAELAGVALEAAMTGVLAVGGADTEAAEVLISGTEFEVATGTDDELPVAETCNWALELKAVTPDGPALAPGVDGLTEALAKLGIADGRVVPSPEFDAHDQSAKAMAVANGVLIGRIPQR